MINKNKHGDVPVTILVIGVVFICGLAIFSFYFSARNVKNDFVSNEAVEQAVIIKNKISLYETLGLDISEIKNLEIESDALGRYFVIEKGSLSVKYYLGK